MGDSGAGRGGAGRGGAGRAGAGRGDNAKDRLFPPSMFTAEPHPSAEIIMPQFAGHTVNIFGPRHSVAMFIPFRAKGGDGILNGKPIALLRDKDAEPHEVRLLRLFFLTLALLPEKLARMVQGFTMPVFKEGEPKSVESALGVLFVASLPPTERVGGGEGEAGADDAGADAGGGAGAAGQTAAEGEDEAEGGTEAPVERESEPLPDRLKRIAELVIATAAYDMRRQPPGDSAVKRSRSTSHLYNSPPPLGCMSSWLELTHKEFIEHVWTKAFHILSTLRYDGDNTKLIFERLVLLTNAQRDMKLCVGSDHPALGWVERLTNEPFAGESYEIGYLFDEDKPWNVFPWAPLFTKFYNSFLTKTPILAQPPHDLVFIKSLYDTYRVSGGHEDVLPVQPGEDTLLWFMYGGLYSERPAELEGWQDESQPFVYWAPNAAIEQSSGSFVDLYKTSADMPAQPAEFLPMLSHVLAQMMGNTRKPKPATFLFDTLIVHAPSAAGFLSPNYSDFLRSLARCVLKNTSARQYVILNAMEIWIAALTRFKGPGLRKHMAFLGIPNCGKSVAMRIFMELFSYISGSFTAAYIRARPVEAWGFVRFADELPVEWFLNNGKGIATGDHGTYRVALLQWLENNKSGHSRYVRDADDNLVAQAGGNLTPDVTFFGCSNAAEASLDPAIASRLHIVNCFGHPFATAMVEMGGHGESLSMGMPETRGLLWLTSAASLLFLMGQCGYFKQEPCNPFAPHYSSIMLQLHRCGALMLPGVRTDMRARERWLIQLAGHATIRGVLRALNDLGGAAFVDRFENFSVAMAIFLHRASFRCTADLQCLVWELTANRDMLSAPVLKDVVSTLRYSVIDPDTLHYTADDYFVSPISFNCRTTSNLNILVQKTQIASGKMYNSDQIEQALKFGEEIIAPHSRARCSVIAPPTPQNRSFMVHKDLLVRSFTHVERLLIWALRTCEYDVALPSGGPARWYIPFEHFIRLEACPREYAAVKRTSVVHFDLEYFHHLPPHEQCPMRLCSILDLLRNALELEPRLPFAVGDTPYRITMDLAKFQVVLERIQQEPQEGYRWLAGALQSASVYFTPPANLFDKLPLDVKAHTSRYEPCHKRERFGAVQWDASWNNCTFTVSFADLAYHMYLTCKDPEITPLIADISRAASMLKAINGFTCDVSGSGLSFSRGGFDQLRRMEEGPVGEWLRKTSGLTSDPVELVFAHVRPDNSLLSVLYNPASVLGQNEPLAHDFNPSPPRDGAL